MTKNFPQDIHLELPKDSSLPENDLHFLIYIPWEEKYLYEIPKKYQDFFKRALPYLSARTTDVHTAICLGYLDEFIQQAQKIGMNPNRDIVAYALILHDSGWSQMDEAEIAASLGVSGLKLSETALAPKEKHAVIGEKIARLLLSEHAQELSLSTQDIEIICAAILYHDKPELVAGRGAEMPDEVKILVDLDHIWSFTHLNFWQDTIRKGIDPKEYLKNLEADLDSYFVTEIGKNKSRELLKERKREVKNYS